MMNLRRLLVGIAMIAIAAVIVQERARAQQEGEQPRPVYTIQPGDRLDVSVWNEPDLQKELLVAPDGGIAFPLVGEINVAGKSIVELRDDFKTKLARYLADPIVTVTIKEVLGNKIYVLGQVNRPGQFVVNPMVDVMQALSMAGGTTAYASLNDISILRRQGDHQISIPFRYGDVASGKNPDLNILLKSGDVVIVP